MVKKWSEMNTFMKVIVLMGLLWVIGVCVIISGYKVIGCVLIWLAVVIDVIVIVVVRYKVWRKRSIKND